MVSIAASAPANISYKGKVTPKTEEQSLGSAKDIINTVEEKSKKFQDGAEQVQDAAKNIEKTVTGCATALTASAGSLMAAGKVFKPLTDKAKVVAQNPNVKSFAGKVVDLSKKVVNKMVSYAKANPKMTIAAIGIVAAAVTAAVIGKAIINAKSEQAAQAAQAEKTAEAKPEAEKAEGKKLDVVSEA